MAKVLYRGFSTAAWEDGNRSFASKNIEVVKQDLLNHIFTVKGERVMMPGFGTRIPSLAFEPIDQRTLNIIDTDLREVFAYDPRVELLDLKIIPMSDNNTILAYASLKYIELGKVDTLHIEVPAGNN
jgi:phage baseplate assembly protein W